VPLPNVIYSKQLAIIRVAREDPIDGAQQLRYDESSQPRCDAKFASAILLESSDAGPHPPNDAFPLTTSLNGCIRPKRDLEVDQHQTLWYPLEDKLLPALFKSIKASAMLSYERLRRVEAGHTREIRLVYVSINRRFTIHSRPGLHFSKLPGSLQHRRAHYWL
jgi:hypothetical protein